MLRPEKFSKSYQVRCLTEADVPLVVELCEKNTHFYEHCPPFVTEDTVREDMKALPRNKTMKDKYYVGYFDGGDLIAVVDLIDACPDESTIFIGFFMLTVSVQGRGIGTKIACELMEHARSLGYARIRLGWVKGNEESEGFWRKNGFSETGISYETNGYTVIVAQREL